MGITADVMLTDFNRTCQSVSTEAAFPTCCFASQKILDSEHIIVAWWYINLIPYNLFPELFT